MQLKLKSFFNAMAFCMSLAWKTSKHYTIGRKLGADNLSAPEEKLAEIIYDEIMREDSLFVWLHE